MVDLTPPSSSANTPKREMDIDEHDEHERPYSSGSDDGEPGASDTELDEAEHIETGQATPPLVEGEAGPSTSTVSDYPFYMASSPTGFSTLLFVRSQIRRR